VKQLGVHSTASRWYLLARAYLIRSAARAAFGLQHRAEPPVPGPTGSVDLDATLGAWKGKGKIRVDIYEPSPARGEGSESESESSAGASEIGKGDGKGQGKGKAEASQGFRAGSGADSGRSRIGIINFHGGGFILGTSTDDARLSTLFNQHLNAVVFSVNYRLAPSYPFPTPPEDCADAIVQIAARAREWGVDPDRLVVCGLSAGGNLALASWMILQDPGRWGYDLPHPAPSLAGMILFYPLLDYSIPRQEKRSRAVDPAKTLPPALTDFFDACYLYPLPDLSDPRLSPGLAPDDVLWQLPPLHICLCEHDMLLAEGQDFAGRLQDMGKQVSMRLVQGEEHGWDKPPPIAQKASVGVEYMAAAEAVRSWFTGGTPRSPGDSATRMAAGDEPMVGHQVLAAQGREKVSLKQVVASRGAGLEDVRNGGQLS
jgi:acetyl esterase/lipase